MIGKMRDASDATVEQNYYNQLFARVTSDGLSVAAAVERVANVYLDGKPQTRGSRKLMKKERDRLFWSSRIVKDSPPDVWDTETMTIALARYLGQEPVAVEGLVLTVARVAPGTLIRAARHSGIVLNGQSNRLTELVQAARDCPEVAELCRVLDTFDLAYRQRVAALDMQKARLKDLAAFDLLIYASLYAFERLVARDIASVKPAAGADNGLQVAWDAINDLLAWKLETADEASLRLTDDSIARSVVRHLRPILFEPVQSGESESLRNLHAFHAVLEAQIELNEFISRSAEAFSYDDGIQFVRQDNRLEIVEVDLAARVAWQKDGRKLERLHSYWFRRAMDEFVAYVAADPVRWEIGRPENADANRLAWIRALQAQLRLREVYGVADEVTADTGESVNLFQALLSLNLMSTFFLRDFLVAFADRMGTAGSWLEALRQLAIDGVLNGQQNRMPLTWSSRDSKVANMTEWTVTESLRQGNPRMASAILDFWTYDMAAMADRLQRSEPGLQPYLFERPVLKFGATFVQLPWIVGMQNNSTAAINNLRRLGTRRGGVRDETQRIEANLARLLQSRGFNVLLNWMPPRDDEVDDPGEVDVIATRDDHLFVFEVKSTFIRSSQRDAWLHATTTLRKAGLQLHRKVEAVSRAIGGDVELRLALGLTEGQTLSRRHGWIVDTSIENDHQHFSGFLKISVEEMLIALRDERHHLKDLAELLASLPETHEPLRKAQTSSATTLYPHGFSAERFVEVIETGAVWDEANNA